MLDTSAIGALAAMSRVGRVSNLSREIEDIIAVVRATEGWRVEVGAHYKAFAPDGMTIITVSKTPGSQSRIKAYKAQFAKLGVTFKQGRKRRS